eukprot:CAMPEP_0185796018 /NCGR_PEP_ID=MMETSP1174-20130828/160856_1 /TAXON_ID=35687 /ORGANISM="Dictyocha speculum, Strain CCMP1381" /LENGTH=262 /DNA_ID=CAMNT_0028491351 /DNA_START=636 /DNA_END=1421 /DNA_ORIENTATION=-
MPCHQVTLDPQPVGWRQHGAEDSELCDDSRMGAVYYGSKGEVIPVVCAECEPIKHPIAAVAMPSSAPSTVEAGIFAVEHCRVHVPVSRPRRARHDTVPTWVIRVTGIDHRVCGDGNLRTLVILHGRLHRRVPVEKLKAAVNPTQIRRVVEGDSDAEQRDRLGKRLPKDLCLQVRRVPPGTVHELEASPIRPRRHHAWVSLGSSWFGYPSIGVSNAALCLWAIIFFVARAFRASGNGKAFSVLEGDMHSGFQAVHEYVVIPVP